MCTVTATRTLTLNPAFLQEIKDDNRQLHALLAVLRELTDQPVVARSHSRQVVEVLQELRDQVALHFALEEAYGYFEDAVDASPRVAIRAAELRGQHAVLFAGIERIADSARRWETQVRVMRAGSSSGERRTLLQVETFRHIVDQFQRFSDLLMQHEHAEQDLIVDVLTTDIGGEG